ncbi:hypothetical protein FIBSPDRAFT_296895 [Athelia psychrophila]|uniref:Uncharacterized protein n=1 Tax=Athelia psychrophila TaxID=1759441 RepID=A0A167X9C4_9AGAM|nr:hypothetical protein FIBSPDRAFT_296895 [Fibularhizoctonia sp. CBS 109695]
MRMKDWMGTGDGKEWDENRYAGYSLRLARNTARPIQRDPQCERAGDVEKRCTDGDHDERGAAADGRKQRAVGMSLRPDNRSFPSPNPHQIRVRRLPLVKRDTFICACTSAQTPHAVMGPGGGSSCSGSAWLSAASAGTMSTQRSSGSGKRGSCGTPVASAMNEATGGARQGGLPAGAKRYAQKSRRGGREPAHVPRGWGGVQVGGDQHRVGYRAGCEHPCMGAGVGGGVPGR